MRVLAGRYELVEFIGRGGMGEVWEGRDTVIGRPVAVKLLPQQNSPDAVELFFREARTAGALNHRGVVTVHDIGQDPADGTLFLVMELVQGSNLATQLRTYGPPPVPTALDLVAQAAAALAAAHQAGVVHRDLKPANLMLTTGGDVKVLDFGIARYMAATHQSSQVMGTLAYMAPERFAGAPGDARSDLYALGCVLYELLTGTPPFQDGDPLAMMTAHLHRAPDAPGLRRGDLPAELDAMVLRLLAKDPAARPASAAELQALLRGTAPTPTTVSAAPPRPQPMGDFLLEPPTAAPPMPLFPPAPFVPAVTAPVVDASSTPTHRGPRFALVAAGLLWCGSLALPLWGRTGRASAHFPAVTAWDLVLGRPSWADAPFIWPPAIAVVLVTVLALVTAWPQRSRLGTRLCWAAIPVGLLATTWWAVMGFMATSQYADSCTEDIQPTTPLEQAQLRRCLDDVSLQYGFYLLLATTALLAAAGVWALVQRVRHRRQARGSA
ncbi:serine/threonine-protein kinase [Kitasatospora viridis]|uniref:non-specific serine/threonine protein kinase n=1 Tax=Kitasatospora viridis TaxID=281105 RepID=A0A561UC34_9ACTN|nr:serine/threonine-protein kinase [Kitasatospora viridis]TWF96922.1 serine/threonine protein kinase [Kitasatospora viridis]